MKGFLCCLIFIIYSGIEISNAATIVKEIINVSEFGAIPNDNIDDANAIQKAIDYAQQNPKVRIIKFESGVYDIVTPQTNDFHLNLSYCSDLMLLGYSSNDNDIYKPSTTLMFYNLKRGGINIRKNIFPPGNPNGRAAEINGFILDYKTPPFAQVTIEAVKDNIVTVKQNVGLDLSDSIYLDSYSSFSYVGYHNKKASNYIWESALVDRNTKWIKPLGSNRYEITYTHKITPTSYIIPGNPLIILARDYRYSMLNLKENNGGLRVKNVTIYSSVGLASEWGKNEAWREVVNLKIEPKDDLFISTNGDGIHGYGNRGTMVIRNCSFEGMADDAINLHARGVDTGIVLQADKKTLSFPNIGTVDYRTGDILVFANKRNGSKLQSAQVASAVLKESTGIYTVTLNDSLLPQSQNSLDSMIIFNESASSGNNVISENEFKAFRGRAIVVQTDNVTIEKNTSNNLLYDFVTIFTSMSWKEGPFPKNILISKNNITSVDPLINGYSTPFIRSSIENQDGSASDAKEIGGIYIKDNKFNNKKGDVSLLLNLK